MSSREGYRTIKLLATQCVTNKDEKDTSNYFHPLHHQSVYKLTLRDGQNVEDVLHTRQLQPY